MDFFSLHDDRHDMTALEPRLVECRLFNVNVVSHVTVSSVEADSTSMSRKANARAQVNVLRRCRFPVDSLPDGEEAGDLCVSMLLPYHVIVVIGSISLIAGCFDVEPCGPEDRTSKSRFEVSKGPVAKKEERTKVAPLAVQLSRNGAWDHMRKVGIQRHEVKEEGNMMRLVGDVENEFMLAIELNRCQLTYGFPLWAGRRINGPQAIGIRKEVLPGAFVKETGKQKLAIGVTLGVGIVL